MIAHLLPPALFHARHITVKNGTKGGHTLGTTVADGWRVTARAPNAVVMGESGPGRVLPVVDGAVGGVRWTLLMQRMRPFAGQTFQF